MFVFIKMTVKIENSASCTRFVQSTLWMILTSYLVDIILMSWSSWTTATIGNLHDPGELRNRPWNHWKSVRRSAAQDDERSAMISLHISEMWLDRVSIDHRTVPVR